MKFRVTILIGLLSINVFASDNIQKITASFKTAASTDQFLKLLKSLSAPDSILEKYNRAEYSGFVERTGSNPEQPLFTRTHFIRAETFFSNLTNDTIKERISQVIFASGEEKTDLKVYFLFIHNGTSSLLWFKCFELMVCDKAPQNLLTFGFNPISGEKHNFIKLDITRVESCGSQIVFYQQADSLFSDGGTFKLKEGAQVKTESSDRFDDLEDMK